MLASLTACSPDPIPDHAVLFSGAPFGTNQDPEQAAIAVGSWAAASPGRTANNPVLGARTAAAVDYLAGDLYANPRWQWVDPLIKIQLLQGREQMRAALGILPNAPSQQVVDSLLSVASAQLVGNGPAVYTSLRSPVFGRGPEQTYASLVNLPPLPLADVALQRLNDSLNRSDRNCYPCG
ncbi:MAG: hypothetical protein JOY70_11135 [Acidisphaera sp.]|nr:hypothetical protein [Acidisphaera sp.]